MSIYTKPFETITWDDVEAFCTEKVQENAYLDYKEDFPNELSKTIAAMANTVGGIILIGVEEDQKESKPVTPLKGIDFKPKLADKVVNQAVAGIWPPVIPDVQVCPNATQDRALVVVRVHQSHQAPHAMKNNTRVYVRTGVLGNPEELTNIDYLEWLLDQRKKSVLFAVDLKAKASERASKILQKRRQEFEKQENVVGYQAGNMVLTVSVCTSYPQNMLMSPSEMKQKAVGTHYRTSNFSLFQNLTNPKLLQSGLIFFDGDLSEPIVEMSGFGLFHYRQVVSAFHHDSPKDVLVLPNLVGTLKDIFISAHKFYTALGYWGPMAFEFALTGIEDGFLSIWGDSSVRLGYKTTLETSIVFKNTLEAKSLKEGWFELLKDCVRQVGWGFNTDFSDSNIEGIFEKVNVTK